MFYLLQLVVDYIYSNRLIDRINRNLTKMCTSETCKLTITQDCNCGTELLKSIAGNVELHAIGMKKIIYDVMVVIVNDKSFDIYDEYIFTTPLRENFLSIKKTCTHTRDPERAYWAPCVAKINITEELIYY